MSEKFLLSFFKKDRDSEKLHSFFNRIRRKEVAIGEQYLNTVTVAEKGDCWTFRICRAQDVDDYFEIEYDLKSRKIEERNNIWIMPFFKVELKDSTHYSSHPFLLMRVLQSEKSLRVDFQSLDHFIEYGYLPINQTFAKDLIKLNSPPIPLATEGGGFDQTKFWQLFIGAIEKIFKNNKSITFNMSGGLDTRFITFALLECGYRPDQVVTVQSPFLIESTDADVEIAKLICSKLNWKHKIETPPPEQYNYFKTAESGEIILSGLYGGEIYGGQVAHFFKNKTLTFNEVVLIALNTYRSIIYSSSKQSWSSPSSLHLYSISPFTDKELLAYMMKFSGYNFADYKQYNKHYNSLKTTFFDMPLCTGSQKLNLQDVGLQNYFDPKLRSGDSHVYQDIKYIGSNFLDYADEKLHGKENYDVKRKNLRNYYFDLLRFSINF